MQASRTEPARETVVILCCANVVRSPLAAGMLRRELGHRERHDIDVVSAGLAVDSAVGTPAEVLEVGRRHGVDVTGLRPAAVTAQQLEHAGMVLTMTEAQRATVARLARSAIARTFTLSELVRLLQATQDEPAATVAELSLRAHRARPLVVAPEEPEDVADPIGQPLHRYEEVAEQLAQLVARVVEQVARGPAVTSV